MPDGSEPYKMRAPCRGCGCEFGTITETGSQDVVRCLDCRRHCYNAPRVETGKKTRTVQTVHEAIKPKHRLRILERANGHCEICGKGPESGCSMHVGHVISVAQGLENGMSDTEINDDENLIALCDECNIGMGKNPVPIRMLVRLFAVRAKRGNE